MSEACKSAQPLGLSTGPLPESVDDEEGQTGKCEAEQCLIILLHAYLNQASSLKSVADEIAKHWPNAAICCPELGASVLSLNDPNAIVCDLLSMVDECVDQANQADKPITSIIIVGHSMGGLIGRKLYVAACGETPDAPFEEIYHQAGEVNAQGLLAARTWAPLVKRIVLLAGMNRGWQISHHLSLVHALGWRLGTVAGYATKLMTGRWPLIFKLRRGAEFITHLRIQWLQLRRLATEPDRLGNLPAGNALTVQLLGSRDDVVSPEDNVDLVAGYDFVYLDVPHSGHADVIRLQDPHYGRGRAKVLMQALGLPADALRSLAATPADDQFLTSNDTIKNVVFVIHGIRDQGFWTHKIARRVKHLAGDSACEWATETSSYGYFPMLPFLLPWYRRSKVEWLMDQYTEALARYPKARFSYVGHSNGTYLVAKALELYPCCRFTNVVFAGSVVRVGYDWTNLLGANPPRVTKVLNFIATSDWVVAFFPKFFQFLRLQDLGSAGHDGFRTSAHSGSFFQVRYVKGGHAAAITEDEWDSIAKFVLTGEVDTQRLPNAVHRKNAFIDLLGRMPPLVWGGIGLVMYLIWEGIELLIHTSVIDPETRGLVTGLALSSYLLTLWLVVTRL
ncbi:alpha/beta fold hydrolase [Pseudomonas entomophila]|uniref:alpha/beta fold hydrolase n=1 Tax=Pseudomonas entomophila TaxID=312306 RepID=UPI001F005126|nr:alpha/beta fold hydrolase [Pseudomonas entomophila]MCG8291258.1 GPI inositol-deacylase [Pseudomonas entomophila]